MTNAFFEVWKFALVDFIAELVDKHIEVSTLIAEYHTDTERVIDDDKGESNGYSEGAGTHSFKIADGG